MIHISLLHCRPLIGAGLIHMFSSTTDICVHEYPVVRDRSSPLTNVRQNIVALIDFASSESQALIGLAELTARKVPALVLAPFPDDQLGVYVMRHGAAGFISDSCYAEELVTAVRKIAAGRKYVSAQLAELMFSNISDSTNTPHLSLSCRELQIYLNLFTGD